MNKKNLFLIVGCGRSGTTLIKSILNHHNNVSVVHETFYFDNIVKNLNKRKNVTYAEAIEYLLSRWWLKESGFTMESILNQLPDDKGSKYDPYLLFQAMLLSSSEEEQVIQIGEKTPSHINYIDEIIEKVPALKVIQMIRDPRAVFTSYSKTNVGSNQVLPVVREWSNAYKVYTRHMNSPNYLLVKYEDLATSPEQTLRSICSFLGVDFTNDLLSFYARKEQGFVQEQRHHAKTLKPLTAERVGAWSGEISLYKRQVIENVLYEEMKSANYSGKYKKLKFMKAYLAYGRFVDFAHKNLVRRPRQLLKMIKATNRIKNSS